MAIDKSKALESMKENLIKYKDAVVIVGNDAVKDAHLFHATENNESIYSRRNMVKNPEEYWKLYKMNIAENEHNKTATKEQKALLELLKLQEIRCVQLDAFNDIEIVAREKEEEQNNEVNNG